MTADQAVSAYSALPRELQIAVLADYAHWLTIVARDTYAPPHDVSDPRRLRELNEVQHCVVGHLRSLLANDSRRYDDDAIVRISVREDDPRLLTVFARAIERCTAE